MIMFFLKCWVYLLYGLDTIGITPRGLRNAIGIILAFFAGLVISRHF
jgi:hypothetical protein